MHVIDDDNAREHEKKSGKDALRNLASAHFCASSRPRRAPMPSAGDSRWRSSARKNEISTRNQPVGDFRSSPAAASALDADNESKRRSFVQRAKKHGDELRDLMKKKKTGFFLIDRRFFHLAAALTNLADRRASYEEREQASGHQIDCCDPH